MTDTTAPGHGVREALSQIIAIDQHEVHVCIDADPAGNTYAVTKVDGPCAEIARRILATLPPEPTAEPVAVEPQPAEEAVRDKARLDFLDRCNHGLNERYGTTYRWQMVMSHNVNRLMLGHMVVDLHDSAANGLPSCRDAIDAEMRRTAWGRAALGGPRP